MKINIDRLYIFCNESRTNNYYYEYLTLSIQEIGKSFVQLALIIKDREGLCINDFPNKFKLVGFDSEKGRMVYIPNVCHEDGKYLLKDGIVSINGKKVETTMIIKDFSQFLNENGLSIIDNNGQS